MTTNPTMPLGTSHSAWMRRILALTVVLLALLLVSAGGQRGHAAGGPSAAATATHGQWHELLLTLAEEVPQEHRAAWREAAQRQPHLFMRVNVMTTTAANTTMIPPPGEELVRP